MGAFVGYLALRARNPDLWHPVFGGEKPMDFAHLNAVIRSATFPPFDPWYAGSQLNYYYFGHVPTAALAKTLGVVPSVAYILALAGYAAGAVAAVYALGYGVWSLFRRGGAPAHAVGFTAVIFVLIAGNLHSGLQLVRIAQRQAADPSSVAGVLARIPLTPVRWRSATRLRPLGPHPSDPWHRQRVPPGSPFPTAISTRT